MPKGKIRITPICPPSPSCHNSSNDSEDIIPVWGKAPGEGKSKPQGKEGSAMAIMYLEVGRNSQSKAHDLFIFLISALLIGAAFSVVIIAGGITELRKITGGWKGVS
jgi:hypothetical protein